MSIEAGLVLNTEPVVTIPTALSGLVVSDAGVIIEVEPENSVSGREIPTQRPHKADNEVGSFGAHDEVETPDIVAQARRRISTADVQWKESGNCRAMDTADFYPNKGALLRAARRACQICSVREECWVMRWQMVTVLASGGSVPRQRKKYEKDPDYRRQVLTELKR